MKEGKIPK